MIHWAWLIPAVFGGCLVGVFLAALCAANQTSRDRDTILSLRVALGWLVRAVEEGQGAPDALAHAHRVLER